MHKKTNKKVALKIYEKEKMKETQRKKSVRREIKLMERLNHPHIAKLYEAIETDDQVILVMEYVSGGSTHGFLKSKPNRRMDEEDARRIFKQVLSALQYCHSKCVCHRDIKLENVMLDSRGNVKIIDFGFSTCIPNDKKIKIFCGTPSYMAPEIVAKKEFCGPPADIWASGVLLYAFFCGCFPFRG
jgi:serine/threonine protein kinase